MINQNFSIIETVFKVLAAIAGILGAFFELRDRSQTSQDREETRAWHREKWETVQRTGILELPERAIAWTLAQLDMLSSRLMGVYDNLPDWTKWIVPPAYFLGNPLLLSAVVYITYGLKPAVVTFAYVLTVAITSGQAKSGSILEHCAYSIGCIAWIAGSLLWLRWLLAFPVSIALIAVVCLFPLLFLCIALPITMIAEFPASLRRFLPASITRLVFLFGSSVALSFVVTVASFALGHSVDALAPIPNYLQMLASNVCFDGLTLLTTVTILRFAITRGKKFPLAIFIVADVVVAAVLACASLWVGVLGTPLTVSLYDTTYILIGRTPEGQDLALGPLFWAMHTTFIPTACYLSLILVTWTGRLVVLPITHILSRGRIVERPHQLTSGWFLLLAAILLAIATIIGEMQRHSKDTSPSGNSQQSLLLEQRMDWLHDSFVYSHKEHNHEYRLFDGVANASPM